MSSAGLSRGLAFHLGSVQFFAALSWIAYVVYLPRMATSAGLPASAVGWILLVDQAVFALADFYLGKAADRVLRVIGTIGPLLVSVTVISGAAFIALPAIADTGGVSTDSQRPFFFALLLVWALTSSVLRAPALALVAKLTPKPSLPSLAALVSIGGGLAAAAAPYLALLAENHGPLWPFALSTATLVAAVSGLARAERRGATSTALQAVSGQEEQDTRGSPLTANSAVIAVFFAAAALLGMGYQVHSNLNAASLYRRFAEASEVPWLLPIFWIGFNLLALVGAWHAKRYGAITTLTGAALLGAVSSLAAAVAPGLLLLACAQFLAGGAWGAIMSVLFAQALALGKPGNEGRMAGRLSALLAIASMIRLGMVNLKLPALPAFALLLPWVPAGLWFLAAILMWRARARSIGA